MINEESTTLFLVMEYKGSDRFTVTVDDLKSHVSIAMLQFGNVKSIRFKQDVHPPKFGWLDFEDEGSIEQVLKDHPNGRTIEVLEGVKLKAKKNKNSPTYMRKRADEVVVNVSCGKIEVGYLTKSNESPENTFRLISTLKKEGLPYTYLKISRKGRRVEWGLRKTSKSNDVGLDDIKLSIKFRQIKTLVIDEERRTLYLRINKTRFPTIWKRCKGSTDSTKPSWRRETQVPIEALDLLISSPWLTSYLNVWSFQIQDQDKDFTKFFKELLDWRHYYAAPFSKTSVRIEPMTRIQLEEVTWLVPFLLNVFIKPKRILWAMNCLLSNSMIDLVEVIAFIQFIIGKEQSDSTQIDRITKTLNGINNDDSQHPDENLVENFDKVFKNYVPKGRTYTDNKYQYVFSVWITPTRQIALRERNELSNRVRRKHHQHHDRFLRVSFVDEDLDMINISSCSTMYEGSQINVENRIDSILNHGITFPGLETFHMLAFSSSQLREKSCWFYSDTPDLSIAAIHKQMGDFSQEKIPAKYAARMGQCFSSTEVGMTLNKDNIIEVPDIPSREPFPPFSDGVGEISSKLAKSLCKKLKLKESPSAAQIRFAGYKGVVSLESPRRWTCCTCTVVNDKNKLSSSHSDHCMVCESEPQEEYLKLRPSMHKFISDHYVLEILNVSRSLTGLLNSQIIIILSELGIKDQIFLKYHKKMLEQMNTILTNETAAHVFLRGKRNGYMNKVLRTMLKSNFTIKNETLLRHCLQAIHYSTMKDLRAKNRIAVPDSKLAIGVLDELRVLEDQQIFFQTKDNDSKGYIVIEGDVIIAKNPALHPGDVRKFKAVNRPELHHLKHCVVFPQVGERPHPNECSGSDLDGDLYFISWCPDLIFPRDNHPAMFFDSQKSKIIKYDNVQLSHIKRFYIEYMKNDILGKVANYHVVWADQCGIFSEQCQKLAELHSIAVDFPKTGVPAVMELDLIPKKFPHCKTQKKSKKYGRREKEVYKSEKILGRLYDATPEPEIEKVEDGKKAPICLDGELLVQGFDKYTEEGKVKMEEYRVEMVRLMNQYGVSSEMEMVSGCSMKEKGRYKKGKWREIMKELGVLMEEVRDRYWEEFKRGVGSSEEERRKKASAWYYTAYADEVHHDDMTKSFGWIPYKVLCNIKKDAA
eukprot:TRINITY_DN3_c16_g1_i1.p1 TRINITY_DN3_c16_g1~~TRINITY_DN3_c16_g1_i1.p1  ORF type:complete len:1150 (+),score=229.80 TRINITY_DN3_c16_g1_i1:131-3580(+)